jgi:hypothetical protein
MELLQANMQVGRNSFLGWVQLYLSSEMKVNRDIFFEMSLFVNFTE